MKIGTIVPQGWVGEYDGWDPVEAWQRTTHLAQEADRLGFESVWLFDHFHTIPRPTDEITFESFTALAALAAVTRRVRLGHVVICTGFRNPALTAKMISTMDTISGGRMELGIGAGWKRDEWVGYGYGFPETKERLARLADDLEVITRMLAGDRHQHATYEGRYARVNDARNVPKPIQRPRVPIMIGGNGPNVTWRLAARHADELNVDGMSPDDVAAALPVIRSRCEEIGRDPATLAVSVHLWGEHLARTGRPRVDLLAAYAELGVSRVMGLDQAIAGSDEALESLAADARAAGIEMAAG
ncbi:MAG TPA: TIGR03560 family F420-dependent LLM class oxidoreductase [Candidatus Limnocylindrales bacterium]|jgi:F420-dependent oxidoreductase-like protein